jgi:NAD(P)H-nitrite reductase large subunit
MNKERLKETIHSLSRDEKKKGVKKCRPPPLAFFEIMWYNYYTKRRSKMKAHWRPAPKVKKPKK